MSFLAPAQGQTHSRGFFCPCRGVSGNGPAGWGRAQRQGPTHPFQAPKRGGSLGLAFQPSVGPALADAQPLSSAWICKEFTTMLLERLPRVGGQVHFEAAPREEGVREEREGVGKSPRQGTPRQKAGGEGSGIETPQLGMNQASQGSPRRPPSSGVLLKLHLFALSPFIPHPSWAWSHPALP